MLLLTRLHRIEARHRVQAGPHVDPDKLDSMRRKAEGGGISWQGRATREAYCRESPVTDSQRNPDDRTQDVMDGAASLVPHLCCATPFGCLRGLAAPHHSKFDC